MAYPTPDQVTLYSTEVSIKNIYKKIRICVNQYGDKPGEALFELVPWHAIEPFIGTHLDPRYIDMTLTDTLEWMVFNLEFDGVTATAVL